MSNIKNNNTKFKIKNGFEFLLKDKNPINLFSKTFCKINLLKKLNLRLNYITIFLDK